MEYQIVSESTPTSLAFFVQGYLDKGWKCQGGVCFVPGEELFLQAIIRTK